MLSLLVVFCTNNLAETMAPPFKMIVGARSQTDSLVYIELGILLLSKCPPCSR